MNFQERLPKLQMPARGICCHVHCFVIGHVGFPLRNRKDGEAKVFVQNHVTMGHECHFLGLYGAT